MSDNGSRKRKMQTEEEPEELGGDVSGGDGRIVHQTSSKLSQSGLKKTKSHHDYGGDYEPTTHRYVVQLGDKTSSAAAAAGGGPTCADGRGNNDTEVTTENPNHFTNILMNPSAHFLKYPNHTTCLDLTMTELAYVNMRVCSCAYVG